MTEFETLDVPLDSDRRCCDHDESRLSDLARASVGKQCVGDLVTALKRAMLKEALRRSGGNFSLASDLLGISRQAVQQMIQRYGLRAWAAQLRESGGEDERARPARANAS